MDTSRREFLSGLLRRRGGGEVPADADTGQAAAGLERRTFLISSAVLAALGIVDSAIAKISVIPGLGSFEGKKDQIKGVRDWLSSRWTDIIEGERDGAIEFMKTELRNKMQARYDAYVDGWTGEVQAAEAGELDVTELKQDIARKNSVVLEVLNEILGDPDDPIVDKLGFVGGQTADIEPLPEDLYDAVFNMLMFVRLQDALGDVCAPFANYKSYVMGIDPSFVTSNLRWQTYGKQSDVDLRGSYLGRVILRDFDKIMDRYVDRAVAERLGEEMYNYDPVPNDHFARNLPFIEKNSRVANAHPLLGLALRDWLDHPPKSIVQDHGESEKRAIQNANPGGVKYAQGFYEFQNLLQPGVLVVSDTVYSWAIVEPRGFFCSRIPSVSHLPLQPFTIREDGEERHRFANEFAVSDLRFVSQDDFRDNKIPSEEVKKRMKRDYFHLDFNPSGRAGFTITYVLRPDETGGFEEVSPEEIADHFASIDTRKLMDVFAGYFLHASIQQDRAEGKPE